MKKETVEKVLNLGNDIEKLTISELREIAKQLEIKGISRANKQGVIDAILEACESKEVSKSNSLEVTDKEIAVLLSMKEDGFYESGVDSTLWLEVFVDTAKEETGLSEKAVGGVLTSLEKKDIIVIEKNVDKDNGSGCSSYVYLSELGKELMANLESCNRCKWNNPKKGSCILDSKKGFCGDFEENGKKDTKKVKKEKKAKSSKKMVVLKTFTGMVIGKPNEDGTPFTYEVLEHDGLYRLTKLDGKVLEFDMTTLKQVNAKNVKFANKIELV